jgi:hypothetical protein
VEVLSQWSVNFFFQRFEGCIAAGNDFTSGLVEGVVGGEVFGGWLVVPGFAVNDFDGVCFPVGLGLVFQ